MVITDSMEMSFSRLREMVKVREAWCAVVHGDHKESDTTERLNNNNFWGFPGDPVAKILSSQCKGPEFNPWSGN